MSGHPARARFLKTGASLVCGLALFATLLTPTLSEAAPVGEPVINEVFARGGSANQAYRQKFIELYNPTDSEISLDGYYLGYAAAKRTPDQGPGNVCALSGTIPANSLFVVTGGTNDTNGTNGTPLVGDFHCSNISPSGTRGALILSKGDAAIQSNWIDVVGYGSAKIFEGSTATYTGGNTTAGAITRTSATDTDDNSADFSFTSEPTPGWDVSLGIENPNSGTDPEEPPAPEIPIKTIAEIQGTGSETPLAGQKVTTTGVVTASYTSGGFNGNYIQTPGSGGTPKQVGDASDGIFVYRPTPQVYPIGACIEVTGTASEYYGLTQLSSIEEVKEVEGCAPVAATELATLPSTDAEKEVYEGMLVMPLGNYTITNNYNLNRYGQIGLAFGDQPLFQATDVVRPGPEAEAYEAENLKKLITLDDGSSFDYTRYMDTNPPLPYLSQESPMRTGSKITFNDPVILDYRYQWNYQPTERVIGPVPADGFITTENDRPATAPEVGGDITLATFNVLNYFNDLGEDEAAAGWNCDGYTDRFGNKVSAKNCKVRGAYTASAFKDQQEKIVTAINKMDADIVALEEIENNSALPWGNRTFANRDDALKNLRDALNSDPNRPHDWEIVASPLVAASITGEDVIRTAFIYNPDQITPIEESIIQLDPVFANARYPLAQEFKVKDTDVSFVVITNHFKSKGSGEDDGTGQGNSNPSRKQQAQAVSTWANEQFPDQAVFLVGDFNAYSMEDPIQIIESNGFEKVLKPASGESTDAAGVAPDADQKTYQFGGRLGSLDHVFANPKAMELVAGSAVWNINADESIAMQYSRRNYNVTDFHTASEFASSDHDPVLVGVKAPKPVTPDPEVPINLCEQIKQIIKTHLNRLFSVIYKHWQILTNWKYRPISVIWTFPWNR